MIADHFHLTAAEVLTLDEMLSRRPMGRTRDQEQLASKLRSWATAIQILVESESTNTTNERNER